MLFVNAGMVPFKEIFTGRQKRPAARATSSQKCVRAGGKHNDLENVGVTARHHTFFEMLGNFSFGDYFKSEACAWAWAFLTNELGLPKDRLWITIHDGDDEAHAILRDEVGIPEERILRCGDADNFWAMGDTGPCGPCTEIRGIRAGGQGTRSPMTRLLELWNLVFMQYERAPMAHSQRPPRASTPAWGWSGSPLFWWAREQHTDLFLPILEGQQPKPGPHESGDSATDVALRVIADHARATTFLVADGVLPSNMGRGYVLRRIMRRAIRQGRTLGFDENFFATACERDRSDASSLPGPRRRTAADSESRRRRDRLSAHARSRPGLLQGGRSLAQAVARSSETAFMLYDTYGFPIDLTRLIMSEQGFAVDEEGFEAAMAAQRQRSRGELGVAGTERVYHQLAGEFGATEFTGYPTADSQGLEGSSEVLALVADGVRVGRVTSGSSAVAVLRSTPFYGESGGQIGDAGALAWTGGAADVAHTGKHEGLHTLEVEVKEGALAVGQVVEQRVDGARRRAIRAHHSATHLLHSALQEVLGEHCKRGSAVHPDRLRFDFTHFSAVTPDEPNRSSAMRTRGCVKRSGGDRSHGPRRSERCGRHGDVW